MVPYFWVVYWCWWFHLFEKYSNVLWLIIASYRKTIICYGTCNIWIIILAYNLGQFKTQVLSILIILLICKLFLRFRSHRQNCFCDRSVGRATLAIEFSMWSVSDWPLCTWFFRYLSEAAAAAGGAIDAFEIVDQCVPVDRRWWSRIRQFQWRHRRRRPDQFVGIRHDSMVPWWRPNWTLPEELGISIWFFRSSVALGR